MPVRQMHAWHAVLAGSMMKLHIRARDTGRGPVRGRWPLRLGCAGSRARSEKPCIRVGPSAALTLASGFTRRARARVRRIVGQDGYATRQAVYGLRELPQAAHRQTRQNSPLPGPPDEAVTIEPVT